MTSSASRTAVSRTVALPPIEWWVWPLRTEPVTAAWLALVVGLAGAASWLVSGSWPLGLVAAATAVAACWPFWMPARYQLSGDGLTWWVLGRRRVPWQAVARFEPCRRGLLVWPDADFRAWDAVRAWYVPWGEHREEVLRQARYYLER